MPRPSRSIVELSRELKAKRNRLAKLQSARTKAARQVEKLDRQIAVLLGDQRRLRGRRGKKAGGRRARRIIRRRPRGKALPDVIVKVLGASGKPMRVKDIEQAVKHAGYRSASMNFYSLVAAALQDESRFKRVSRGQYKLAS